MQKQILFMIVLLAIGCHNTKSNQDMTFIAENAKRLISSQIANSTIDIVNYSELRIDSDIGLPKYCTSCWIDIVDTSLNIISDHKNIVFTCQSHPSSAISIICSPPLPSGTENSGGGDNFTQEIDKYIINCKEGGIADSIAYYLNQLRFINSKKLKSK